MKCLFGLAMLLTATTLPAAPVPKELRTNASTVGTWQLVTVDANNPGNRVPANQYWIIDADCAVIFSPSPNVTAGTMPTEILKFDPKTGEVDHSLVGGIQRTIYGVYELKGDLLTICLDTAGNSRPKTVADSGKSTWHLQRVKESK